MLRTMICKNYTEAIDRATRTPLNKQGRTQVPPQCQQFLFHMWRPSH